MIVSCAISLNGFHCHVITSSLFFLVLVETEAIIYTLYPTPWSWPLASLGWLAFGWPWSCDLRANSRWKGANQTGSQAT